MDALSSYTLLASLHTDRIRDRLLPIMSERLRLQVRQSPRDLLAPRGVPCEPEAQSASTRSGRHGVEAWQDELGELYFKDASFGPRDYVATLYGLATPHYSSYDDKGFPPETSRVARLKRAVVKFLWELMEDASWGMRDLFCHFGARPSGSLAQYCAVPCIDFESFTEFIARSGFQSSRAPPSRQEWFVVFRSIQELSIASVGGISFSAFRTALLDPFHMVRTDQTVLCALLPSSNALALSLGVCLGVLETVYASLIDD